MKRLFLLAAFLAAGSWLTVTGDVQTAGGCGSGYYQNSRGTCIPSPRRARPNATGGARGLMAGGDAGVPAGASARCRDGAYSFSQSRSGTRSRHGGVASWL